MFLFTKKTKNIIKWFWIVFATLIILSMVFTYSGFTMLAGTTTPQPQEIPPEVLEQLLLEEESTSTTVVELTNESMERESDASSNPAEQDTMESVLPEPEQPPVPELNFSI